MRFWVWGPMMYPWQSYGLSAFSHGKTCGAFKHSSLSAGFCHVCVGLFSSLPQLQQASTANVRRKHLVPNGSHIQKLRIFGMNSIQGSFFRVIDRFSETPPVHGQLLGSAATGTYQGHDTSGDSCQTQDWLRCISLIGVAIQ